MTKQGIWDLSSFTGSKLGLDAFPRVLLGHGQGESLSLLLLVPVPGTQRAKPSAPRGWVPVIARRISVAAASLISRDACSLYQAVWGVQIRLGASFNGP